MKTFICIDCRKEHPYRGVGQYCCDRCHKRFRYRMEGKLRPEAVPCHG